MLLGLRTMGVKPLGNSTSWITGTAEACSGSLSICSTGTLLLPSSDANVYPSARAQAKKKPLLFFPLLHRQQKVLPVLMLTERLPLRSPHSGQTNTSSSLVHLPGTTRNVLSISCFNSGPIM